MSVPLRLCAVESVARALSCGERTTKTTRDGVRVARRAGRTGGEGRLLDRGGGGVSSAPLWWEMRGWEWRRCGDESYLIVVVSGWCRVNSDRQIKIFFFLKLSRSDKNRPLEGNLSKILFLVSPILLARGSDVRSEPGDPGRKSGDLAGWKILMG